MAMFTAGIVHGSRTRRAGAASAGRQKWIAALPSILVLVAGCYTYRPIMAAPQPGAYVALDLNDRGRVGVGDSLGPEVGRVEGVLVANHDSAYVLRVSAVEGLRGGRSTWSGETVSLRQDYVRNVQERQLSKQRTALFAGGVVAAIGAFILTRDLVGSGSDPGDDPGDGTGEAKKGRPGVGLRVGRFSVGVRIP